MAVAIGEVFFQRWLVVVGGVLKRAVVVHCGHGSGGMAELRRLAAAVSTDFRRGKR